MRKIKIVYLEDSQGDFFSFREKLIRYGKGEFELYNPYLSSNELKARGKLYMDNEEIIRSNLKHIENSLAKGQPVDIILVDDVWSRQSRSKELIQKVKKLIENYKENNDKLKEPLIFIMTANEPTEFDLLDTVFTLHINGIIFKRIFEYNPQEVFDKFIELIALDIPTPLFFQQEFLPIIIRYISQGIRNYPLLRELMESLEIPVNSQNQQEVIELLADLKSKKTYIALYSKYQNIIGELPTTPSRAGKKEKKEKEEREKEIGDRIKQITNRVYTFLGKIENFFVERHLDSIIAKCKSSKKEQNTAEKDQSKCLKLEDRLTILALYNGLLLWNEIKEK